MSHVYISDKEFKLDSGKVVTVDLTIVGEYDPNYGADADGNRGSSMWFIEHFSYELQSDEEIDQEEKEELDEKVEDFVYAESWDFESGSEKEYEHEDDL